MQTESGSHAKPSKRALPPTPQKSTVATPASSSDTETVSPTPASHQTQIASSTPTPTQPPPRPPRPPRPKSTHPPPQPPPTTSGPDIQRIGNKGKPFNGVTAITR